MDNLGSTYDRDRDGGRITLQRAAVWDAIRSGQWWTLGELEEWTGFPQPSISARLRDFRKRDYGSHTIERQYVSDGLWRYRRVLPEIVQERLAL